MPADHPDAPHNLLVTLELNSTSQSGAEDLVGIALGGIIEDRIPPGRYCLHWEAPMKGVSSGWQPARPPGRCCCKDQCEH